MPYICRTYAVTLWNRVSDVDRSAFHLSRCFLFHRHVFGAGRSNLGVGLLARIGNRTYWRSDDGTGGAVCSLEGGRLPGDRRHHRGSRNDCASVLQKTLDEERATDKKLATLAESRINLRAAS